MSCQNGSPACESELCQVLAGLAETDPAYAAALSDLAIMKLNQGEVAEAQRMFDRVITLRSDQLDAAPPASNRSHITQSKQRDSDCVAASSQPPRKPRTKLRSENCVLAPTGSTSGSPLSTSEPAAIPATNPCINSSSGSTVSGMKVGSSSSSNITANGSHDTTPASRPRCTSGMAGGAALFARALGARPISARPKKDSGCGPGSERQTLPPPPTAPDVLATAATAAVAAPGDIGLKPEPPFRGCMAVAEAGPSECLVREEDGEMGQQRHQQQQQQQPSTGGEIRGTRSSSSPGTATAAPAGPTTIAATAAVAAVAIAAEEELGRLTPQPDPDVDVSWKALEGTRDRSPLQPEGPASTSAAGPQQSAGGCEGPDGYLATAAAAVAAMTVKPSSGSGWGSAGCRTATGGSRASTVNEYHIDPRGGGIGSDDDGSSANETDAALRASLGECRHVIEVYGLTTEIRMSHLQEFVSEFASQDGRPLPVIKWVDDHHALLVCPDGATAQYLLQVDQELFQLRSFAEASGASQAVAAADLLPPRERPKTTAAVAKRLLSHALGMSQLRDKEAERDLAQQRKAAREARQERERKVAAAWDDD